MNFVFDIDGTICFTGKNIEEEICSALDECLDKGHEVIFASARPIRDLLPVLPKRYHHVKMVGGNGAFTFKNGKIEVIYFKQEIVIALKKLIESYQLKYLADSDWDYSFTGEEDHTIFKNLDSHKTAMNKPLEGLNGISKMVIFSPPAEVKQALHKMPVSLFEHHSEELIDISPLGIDKQKGLRQLGITEFIAFGNDANDKRLFQHAKHSICVGNHPVSVYANEIVNRENVAKKIKELAKRYVNEESVYSCNN